jgi:hypothetical protein
MPDIARPRIALIGARRGRQGLGPHLARHLCSAGALVTCHLGTTPNSVAEAGRALEQFGIAARGYVELEALMAAERVDAFVVASPVGTHRPYLERALSAGLHVLCEKPILWGTHDAVQAAARFEDDFAARGLVLFENCQWPFVLDAFRVLHPEAPTSPRRAFHMWMGPTSIGSDMLVDALSHPLSVLQALSPGAAGPLSAVQFSTLDADARRLSVSFTAHAAVRDLTVRVDLESTPVQPRPAGLSVDGYGAARRVSTKDYALFLADGMREVPLPDPMERLVTEFVKAVRPGATALDGPWNRGIAQRLAWLEQLVSAYRADED